MSLWAQLFFTELKGKSVWELARKGNTTNVEQHVTIERRDLREMQRMGVLGGGDWENVLDTLNNLNPPSKRDWTKYHHKDIGHDTHEESGVETGAWIGTFMINFIVWVVLLSVFVFAGGESVESEGFEMASLEKIEVASSLGTGVLCTICLLVIYMAALIKGGLDFETRDLRVYREIAGVLYCFACFGMFVIGSLAVHYFGSYRYDFRHEDCDQLYGLETQELERFRCQHNNHLRWGNGMLLCAATPTLLFTIIMLGWRKAPQLLYVLGLMAQCTIYFGAVASSVSDPSEFSQYAGLGNGIALCISSIELKRRGRRLYMGYFSEVAALQIFWSSMTLSHVFIAPMNVTHIMVMMGMLALVGQATITQTAIPMVLGVLGITIIIVRFGEDWQKEIGDAEPVLQSLVSFGICTVTAGLSLFMGVIFEKRKHIWYREADHMFGSGLTTVDRDEGRRLIP